MSPEIVLFENPSMCPMGADVRQGISAIGYNFRLILKCQEKYIA